MRQLHQPIHQPVQLPGGRTTTFAPILATTAAALCGLVGALLLRVDGAAAGDTIRLPLLGDRTAAGHGVLALRWIVGLLAAWVLASVLLGVAVRVISRATNRAPRLATIEKRLTPRFVRSMLDRAFGVSMAVSVGLGLVGPSAMAAPTRRSDTTVVRAEDRATVTGVARNTVAPVNDPAMSAATTEPDATGQYWPEVPSAERVDDVNIAATNRSTTTHPATSTTTRATPSTSPSTTTRVPTTSTSSSTTPPSTTLPTTTTATPTTTAAPSTTSPTTTRVPIVERVAADATVLSPPIEPVGLRQDGAVGTPYARVGEHVVTEGESFWSIAADTVRQAGLTEDRVDHYWTLLLQANEDRLPVPGVPDLLYPGTIIRLPAIGAKS